MIPMTGSPWAATYFARRPNGMLVWMIWILWLGELALFSNVLESIVVADGPRLIGCVHEVRVGSRSAVAPGPVEKWMMKMMKLEVGAVDPGRAWRSLLMVRWWSDLRVSSLVVSWVRPCWFLLVRSSLELRSCRAANNKTGWVKVVFSLPPHRKTSRKSSPHPNHPPSLKLSRKLLLHYTTPKRAIANQQLWICQCNNIFGGNTSLLHPLQKTVH
jgi:hypothetical protein